jgi:hypothetical protein
MHCEIVIGAARDYNLSSFATILGDQESSRVKRFERHTIRRRSNPSRNSAQKVQSQSKQCSEDPSQSEQYSDSRIIRKYPPGVQQCVELVKRICQKTCMHNKIVD